MLELSEKEKALLHRRDTWGWLPIHNAASKGDMGLLEKSLAAGVDINVLVTGDPHGTPLYHAVKNGRHAVTNFLLDRGAKIYGMRDARMHPFDDVGHSVLSLAIRENAPSFIVKRLIDLWKAFLGQCASFILPFPGDLQNCNPELVGLLRNRGVRVLSSKQDKNIESSKNTGETALHVAVREGNLPEINRLLESREVSVDAVCEREIGVLGGRVCIQGITPLYLAAEMNCPLEIFSTLLGYGANPNHTVGVSHEFFESDYNPDYVGVERIKVANTPIEVAQQKGYFGVVKQLEADISTRKATEARISVLDPKRLSIFPVFDGRLWGLNLVAPFLEREDKLLLIRTTKEIYRAVEEAAGALGESSAKRLRGEPNDGAAAARGVDIAGVSSSESLLGEGRRFFGPGNQLAASNSNEGQNVPEQYAATENRPSSAGSR